MKIVRHRTAHGPPWPSNLTKRPSPTCLAGWSWPHFWPPTA